MIEYINELREACLEAYTGIIQGLKGDGAVPSRKWIALPVRNCSAQNLLCLVYHEQLRDIFITLLSAEVQNAWNFVPSIVMFLELIALDKDHSETVVAAACGLVGYVLTIFLDMWVQCRQYCPALVCV